MLRVFRQSGASESDDGLWSFSYIDWQGKTQVGVGTESRLETEQLAERVQQEHHLLRKHRRTKRTEDIEPLPNAAPPRSLDIVFTGASNAEAARLDTAASDAPIAGRIGEKLIQAGLVSSEDVEAALRHQEVHGGRIIEIIIKRQLMTPEAYLHFMGSQPGTPYIDLDNCMHIPPAVIQLVPATTAERFEVIPIDRIGKMLSVAMFCPADRGAIALLERDTGLKVRPMLCSYDGFRNALLRHYRRTPQHAGVRNPV